MSKNLVALSACRCTFQRAENGPVESGVAVTTAHGLSSVVTIVPDTAKTHDDVVKDIWNYWLDWSHSIDADHLEVLTESPKAKK